MRNLCYKGRLTFTVSLGDKLINPILSPYEPYKFFFFFFEMVPVMFPGNATFAQVGVFVISPPFCSGTNWSQLRSQGLGYL